MISPQIVRERPPGLAARVLSATVHATVRNALKIGCHVPHPPWPYGLVELGARLMPRPAGTESSTVELPNCTAQLVQASGITRNPGRVILYFHGGGFFVCGPNTHANVVARLSKYADCPVLVVDYRMLPKHSMDDSVQDCLDAYWWLRDYYEPEQIVFAGDSAGGYLALETAINVRSHREMPAALTLMSPLLELDPGPKKLDPNIHCDAMFSAETFDFLARMVRKANGGALYEPLNWLPPGLPPVLIHVSGSEVLLHDAEVATRRLSGLDVPVELHIWPGQMHVFQIAAPLVPEADRSLKQIGARAVIATLKSAKKDGLEALTGCMRTVG